MTTSGTSTQVLTGLDLVTTALELLGATRGSAAPSARAAEQALKFLNLMIKGWGVNSHLWLTTGGVITLLDGVATYALPAAVYEVVSIQRHISGNDLALTEWSREDYDEQPTKAQIGSPLNWYQNRQLGTLTVSIWPVPNATIAASTTLNYTYMRQIEVFILASTPDLPEAWQEAIVYNLAARLLAIYPQDPQTSAAIRQTAKDVLDAMIGEDQEETSLYFQPATQFSR